MTFTMHIHLKESHLVHVLPLCATEPHAEPDGVGRPSVEQVEPNGGRGGPCHPQAVIGPHGNDGEESGETLQACVVGAPAWGWGQGKGLTYMYTEKYCLQ